MSWLQQLSTGSDPSKPDVFLIPGFLTELRDVRYGPESVDAASDATPWARRFAPLLRYIPANFFLVNWPSKTVFPKLRALEERLGPYALWGVVAAAFYPLVVPKFILKFLVKAARQPWFEAVQNAEQIAGELSDLLAQREQPYLLVGHSLGGRIAMRCCERAGSRNDQHLPRAIALAPAISENEINWQAFLNYRPDNLEVLFSRNDRVLKMLFPIGQGSTKSAIGLVGVPKEHEDKIRSVDATSRRHRKSRGHTDYEEDLLFLLSESPLWIKMFPGTNA